jgi:deoxyribodipyrimidine photo-lyase
MEKIIIFWFRRDLRLYDNHAFFKALSDGLPVLPVFIFDKNILERLNSKNDARVSFIYSEILKIKNKLESAGSSLKVLYSSPENAFRSLLNEYCTVSVYANKDYEPYARHRDEKISRLLSGRGVPLYLYKDHLIFEGDEMMKNDGTPYTIFTPYSKRWKNLLLSNEIEIFPSEKLTCRFLKTSPFKMPELNEAGFTQSTTIIPVPEISETLIRNYAATRDIPDVRGTSRAGVHLRFGTLSIRYLARRAIAWSDVFLNELIWRDFFSSVLWHFPKAAENSFNYRYDFINWRNDEDEFERWQYGQTGYPFVDAGMRELLETGFMHNRVRMVTASFLAKHLLIDWRWGEAWFAEHLLDFDQSSNNGNWQWAAGSGCDAAPYFRIFNPFNQQKRFDPDMKYVKKWVPEVNSPEYPEPLVDHVYARKRALEYYQSALKEFR